LLLLLLLLLCAAWCTVRECGYSGTRALVVDLGMLVLAKHDRWTVWTVFYATTCRFLWMLAV
jgi:hypothetical protein